MSEPTNGVAVEAPTPSAPVESSNPPPKPESRDQKAPPAAPDAAPKLSPAELKKRAKAEKQARRAEQKASSGAPTQEKANVSKDQKQQNKPAKDVKGGRDEKPKTLPVRRRPSQPAAPPPKDLKKEPKKEQKQAGLFFNHLYNQPRQHHVVGANKDVHPAVLALGLQYSSYVVCGSTARMVAMLLAFKAVGLSKYLEAAAY